MILKTGIGLGLALNSFLGFHPPQITPPSFIDNSQIISHKHSSIETRLTESWSPRSSYEADYLARIAESEQTLSSHYYELGFRPLKSDASVLSEQKLAFADQLGIPYTVIRKQDKRLPIPAWQYRLEFNFGKINEETFDLLLEHYGHISSLPSKVSYNPNKIYKLKDFLPPIVKELEGTRLEPSNKAIPEFIWSLASAPLKRRQKPRSSLYTNCWGIAYEALRGASDFKLFYAKANWMLDTLRAHSTQLASASDLGSFPDPSRLKTGDIVIVSHMSEGKEYFDHTAIVVDNGLYFEKAGSGGKTPSRIIDQDNLHSLWKPGVFNYEWRRPVAGAKWEDPKQIFSLSSKKALERFPGLKNMPDIFLGKHSADWEEEEDGSTYLSIYDMRTVSSNERSSL